MRRLDLVADCGSCAAVCCVVLPFDASEDFAFDKAANVACRHLRTDCQCAIHDELVERGLSGCAIYDCYGAGPRVTRDFAAKDRHAAFLVLRVIHELLWMVTETAKLLPPEHRLVPEMLTESAALDASATQRLHELVGTDTDLLRARVNRLLRRVGDALEGRERVRLDVR